MALILSIETSEVNCSVALSNNYDLIGTFETTDERSHAAMLTVLIQKLLKIKEIDIGELNAVAISRGPGSYTGLRIGVSVAKGICYALNIPLIAINTLQLISLGLIQSGKIKIQNQNLLLCPMIDARRKEVYRALFDHNANQVSTIEAEIIDDNSFQNELLSTNIVFFGSGAEKCKIILQNPNAIFIDGFKPNASYMVSLAYDAFLNNNFEDCAYFEPFYLKDFIATIPKRKTAVSNY